MNRGNKESKIRRSRVKPTTSGLRKMRSTRNLPRAKVTEERARARSIEQNKLRASSRAETTKRQRERAMRILQEETGTAGTQSEIDRVALREKRLNRQVGTKQ